MAIKHTFIHKKGEKTKNLTALKALREKCLECCGWSTKEVAECTALDCALYPFRFGRYPKK
jgi:hypothetical protein